MLMFYVTFTCSFVFLLPWLLESSSLPLALVRAQCFSTGQGGPCTTPSSQQRALLAHRPHLGWVRAQLDSRRSCALWPPWRWKSTEARRHPARCPLQVRGRLRPVNSLGSQPAPWDVACSPSLQPPPPPRPSTQLRPGLPRPPPEPATPLAVCVSEKHWVRRPARPLSAPGVSCVGAGAVSGCELRSYCVCGSDLLGSSGLWCSRGKEVRGGDGASRRPCCRMQPRASGCWVLTHGCSHGCLHTDTHIRVPTHGCLHTGAHTRVLPHGCSHTGAGGLCVWGCSAAGECRG